MATCFTVPWWHAFTTGDEQLRLHEVVAGNLLGDGMLYLKARVHLHEVERLILADQKLNRAGTRILERFKCGHSGGLHGLQRRVGKKRRGRFLNQFLVTTLDRAFALAENQSPTLTVAHHLNFDVVRVDDRLLEVHSGVAKGGLGLGARSKKAVADLVGSVHEAHSFATTARCRLQQHRIARLFRDDRSLFRPRQAPCRARHER